MPNPESTELSERELDILRLVATGASNKEIARKLFISSNTVKVHLRNIFTKIGANSRTEAAMYAVHTGLVATASAQILPGDASLQSSESIDLSATGTTSGPKKASIRYFALFGVIFISLAILGFVFLRDRIIPTEANVPTTPTERVQWFELPGLPTPRTGLAVVNYENQIYAIGGKDANGISSVVERYDPQADSWVKLAPKPTPVTDISAAAIGGLIYVPGGKLSSGSSTNITEIFDPRTNRWMTGSTLPKPVSGYALAVYEGQMFLFGGWDGGKVVSDAYVYDPQDETWTPLPSMPTARSYAGAVTVGAKIYVIGGWDGQNALNVNEVYLPMSTQATSRWIEAKPLPSGRFGMGITNLADIIFIIGGKDSGDQLSTIALSQEDKDWKKLESPLQLGWSFLGATTIGSRLYALGGGNDSSLSSQMWSYQAIYIITLPIIR